MRRLYPIIRWINAQGRAHSCYICQARFFRFERYRGGSRSIPEFRRKLGCVGSDVDNFRCIFCGANDRERHLFMYFDAMDLWQTARAGRVLHFAPEQQLANRLAALGPDQYIKADLNPGMPGVIAIDATRIPFDADTFDLLIANHVLEHIPDFESALSEFQRVLKPGGFAVLQTPYSTLLQRNFEDAGIDSEAARAYFYGQEDHVRTFAQTALFESIAGSGLALRIADHADVLGHIDPGHFGVNSAECLILAQKTPETSTA